MSRSSPPHAGLKAGFAILVLGGLVAFYAIVFIGSSPVEAAYTKLLFPIKDGAWQQWTPSVTSSHYALVDEQTGCNGLADYVSTLGVGKRDAYFIPLRYVPTTTPITEIAIAPCASRVYLSGTTTTMSVFYIWNGKKSADLGNYPITGLKPVTLATTTFKNLSLWKTTTSSLQIGAVVTSGNGGVLMSRIHAQLSY